MAKKSVAASLNGAEEVVTEDLGAPRAHDGSSKVSLVIVNKNERLIGATLKALEHYVGGELCEVLVVDASNFALDDIRVANEWVRWIDYKQPPGVRITIAHQRNVGVREAIGDVIVFTDSGCLPEDGWLENLLAPILSGDESVTCGPAKATAKSVYSGSDGAETLSRSMRRWLQRSICRFDEKPLMP